MDRDPKIIQFPPRGSSPSQSPQAADEVEDWDAWCEADYYLLEEEDYVGLVEHRRARADCRPDDPYAQSALGVAYVLNGEYQKAIDFLSEHHRDFPENTDYQHTLLDALFALGKTEDDFDWAERPVILRLTQQTLDACYEYLKPKRKPRSGSLLHLEVTTGGYPLFDADQLLEALQADCRFSIIREGRSAFLAEVSVVRKSRGR